MGLPVLGSQRKARCKTTRSTVKRIGAWRGDSTCVSLITLLLYSRQTASKGVKLRGGGTGRRIVPYHEQHRARPHHAGVTIQFGDMTPDPIHWVVWARGPRRWEGNAATLFPGPLWGVERLGCRNTNKTCGRYLAEYGSRTFVMGAQLGSKCPD